MSLPGKFIDSLVGTSGFSKESFENIHDDGRQVTSVRINPKKYSFLDFPVLPGNKIPWTEYGYYLENRPSFTFDPFFHAGHYYVQEASSMFLEQVISQLCDLTGSLKVLDLCAAPGGKSTHLLSILSNQSLLVSNELIRSRIHALQDNLVKWGNNNIILTGNDAVDFQKLPGYFDVIVVDAPCSGSGLFRKEPEAINEWSPDNVALCSQRQQRILADVLPSLKENGVLIYSTCSYSEEENEAVSAWLIKELDLEFLSLRIESSWNITETEPGYRFWPDKLKGEGFYISCFRKKNDSDSKIRYPKKKDLPVLKKERSILENYIDPEGLAFLQNGKIINGFPEIFLAELSLLQSFLFVKNFGTSVGELIRGKLVPDHALAMSNSINKTLPSAMVGYDMAIDFLKKKTLGHGNHEPGWNLVKYKDAILGWINVLPGRINNYYPKELRILKDL